MKILHITESFGGGVATSIGSFVNNSPGHEHHLIASTRLSAKVSAGVEEIFASCTEVRGSWIKNLRYVASRIRSLDPDYIHLHSSFAGLFGRLLPVKRSRIIYTPHCFSFERRDLNPLTRAALFLAELVLSSRSKTLAAISPREKSLGRRMLFGRRLYIPNCVFLNDSPSDGLQLNSMVPKSNNDLLVVAVGRICPQKDPSFFAEAYKHLLSRGVKASFVWAGGGDEQLESLLRESGILVTGWKSYNEILDLVKESDLYFHTALWEGAPMSMIEAAALNIPILARSIPSLASLSTPNMHTTAVGCAEFIESFNSDIQVRQSALAQTANFARQFHPDRQKQALEELYSP